MLGNSITKALERASGPVFSIYCTGAAFATYFCMYAFRKPFAVGLYEGRDLWGVDFKIVLVLTQVLGYTLSKFTGIKVVSEMTPGRRVRAILVLIGAAEIALVLFGLVPPPYNFPFLFINGLGLGMIWGIVFSFLEGRRFTEMLGAGLCTSFIVASGAVKSVGKSLVVNHGISEYWMPALTGLIFVPPLLISVWLLSRIPPPTSDDRAARCRRESMDQGDRIRFLREFAVGIFLLVAIYVILNAFRDFRDNFAVEIWSALGYGDAPVVFTLSEIPIAICVMISTAVMVLFKNNVTAFKVSLCTIIIGGLMVAASTYGFERGLVSPALWIVLVGLGMYLPYIAFHVMVYERLIAIFRRKANVGFLMYVSDAFGYAGAVAIMLYKNFGAKDLSWVEFFVGASYFTSAGIIVLALLAIVFFRGKLREYPPDTSAAIVSESRS